MQQAILLSASKYGICLLDLKELSYISKKIANSKRIQFFSFFFLRGLEWSFYISKNFIISYGGAYRNYTQKGERSGEMVINRSIDRVERGKTEGDSGNPGKDLISKAPDLRFLFRLLERRKRRILSRLPSLSRSRSIVAFLLVSVSPLLAKNACTQ